jgi:hypothetical protein
MLDRDQQNGGKDSLQDNLSGKNKGMQGIDKAPGEEPAMDTESVSWETQKGKNKVDGDPDKESDRPIEQ